MRSVLFLGSAMLMAVVSAPPKEDGKGTTPPKPSAPSRPASAWRSSEIVKFLQMNPEEKFDIEAINAIDSQALLDEAHGDKRILREIQRTAEALLPRVRAETEDPILVSAILRSKTLDWYRHSPSDKEWGASTPVRWGGIFHESRVPGGRLSRKLSARLTNLITQCIEGSGTIAFLRAGAHGLFRGSAMLASIAQFGLGSKRPRLTQQVAQAYLDDLAATSRSHDQLLPLERLSDLARRASSQEVNVTLVELFPQEVPGILAVVDPRFHPGMNALSIRVVPAKTSDDASTYDLVQGVAHPIKESGGADAADASGAGSSPWEREDMTKKDWLALFKLLEKRKARLDAPPRDNPRDRDSYLGLRDLILAEPAIRKGFLAVHWKGKPAGLTLLSQLLADGTLTPEVETDGDYLEAELDHPEKGHADRHAKDGHWTLAHGWTVTREFKDGRSRSYRAELKSGD